MHCWANIITGTQEKQWDNDVVVSAAERIRNSHFWLVLRSWLPRGSFSGRERDDQGHSNQLSPDWKTNSAKLSVCKTREVKNRITSSVFWGDKRQLKRLLNFWCKEDQHCRYQWLRVNFCRGKHLLQVTLTLQQDAAGSSVPWIWTLRTKIGVLLI